MILLELEGNMAVSKIIYTNGILTDVRGAAETTEQIRQLTGTDTEMVHNGSTSLETAGKISASLIEGFACLAWCAFNKDNSKIRDWGYSSLSKAGKVWLEVQKEKELCAKILTGRVQAYLDQDKSREILLIFHSQGAHVGYQALKNLEQYKGRIHVIAMGGMIRISDTMAKTVVNLAHADDLVPNYVAPVLGFNGESTGIGDGGHDASSYLKNPLLINYLSRNHIIEKTAMIDQYALPPIMAC